MPMPPAYDPTPAERKARQCVGPNAVPTAHLRLVQFDGRGRMQQRWDGSLGSVWLDIDVVQLLTAPPHTHDTYPPPEQSDGEPPL